MPSARSRGTSVTPSRSRTPSHDPRLRTAWTDQSGGWAGASDSLAIPLLPLDPGSVFGESFAQGCGVDGHNRQAPGIPAGFHVVGAWSLAQDSDEQMAPLVEIGVGRECRDGLIVDLVFLGRDLDRGPLEPIPILADVPQVAGGFCSPIQAPPDHVDRLLGRQRRGLNQLLLGLLAIDDPGTDQSPRSHTRPSRPWSFARPPGPPQPWQPRIPTRPAHTSRPLAGLEVAPFPFPLGALGSFGARTFLAARSDEIRDQPVRRRAEHPVEQVLLLGAVRVLTEDGRVAVAVEDLDAEALTGGRPCRSWRAGGRRRPRT